jgi:hypothetical protein
MACFGRGAYKNLQEDGMALGFRVPKDRVIMGGNANKDYKLQLVIYHAKNPKALRGFQTFPSQYPDSLQRVGCHAQYPLNGSMINCIIN